MKRILKTLPLLLLSQVQLFALELSYSLNASTQSNTTLYGVKFHPIDSRIIVYGDSHVVTFYNSNGLKNLGAIESKNDEIMAVDISKDGKYLATGGDDGYVEIWDLNSYQLIHRMKSNSDDTFALAFSADSSKLASAGEEEVIDVWSVQGGEQLAKLEGHREDIRTLSFIDFDRKIVSTSEDKQVKVWNVLKKREQHSYLAPSNEYGDIKSASSVDDYTVVALTEVENDTGNSRKRNGPPVWKYTLKAKDNQGNTLKSFSDHRGPITAVDISKDKSFMVSSSEDKTIRLWDLENRKSITNIVVNEYGKDVSINGDGTQIVALLGDRTIKVWNIKNAYANLQTNQVQNETIIKNNSSWYRKQYAIVVGINHYAKSSIPRLNNAVQDARSIAKLLKEKGFSTLELYNENASKQRILDAIREIKRTSNKEDSTLFYFAGHGDGVSGHNGVREGYILPYDFHSDLHNANIDVMYYDKSAISISSLVKYTRDTKAKHIGIVLDSCFSGLAMESKYATKSIASSSVSNAGDFGENMRAVRLKKVDGGSTTVNIMNTASSEYQDLLAKKSINILTAGKDTPVSDGTGHSPFTQALLNTFSNNMDTNGYIKFTTLAQHVANEVRERTHNRQEPQYRNDSLEGGDFIFKF
jgi:WD40 repeat protein